MELELPQHINYWITATSKHDCFFNVGPESGPKVRIGAIKCLLVAHSEVLHKMLDESPLAETGEISLIDSDPDTFMNFLKCLYGGVEVVVRNSSFEKCLKLLYLCEKYLTVDIKDHISSLILQLYQHLTVGQVLAILSNPACYTSSSDSLTKAISKAIQNNCEEVLNHKSFVELDSSAVIFIAKQEQISTKEINLWVAVLKWAKKKVGSEDPKSLRLCLEEILKYIRFCAMDGNDVCKLVAPTDVLTHEEVYKICKSIGTKVVPELNGLSCEISNRSVKKYREVTFTFVLNNIKQFTGDLESPKNKLGEFNWHLLLQKRTENALDVYICCSSASGKVNWKCSAKTEFTLVNHKSNRHNFVRKTQLREFTSKSADWGFPNFYTPFDDLVNIKKGFIKNNGVVIVANVEVSFIY